MEAVAARRAFGSLIPRTRSDGTVGSCLAEYTYHGHTVRRTFDSESDAGSWLEAERRVVDLDKAGVRPWSHPDTRVSSSTDVHSPAFEGDPLFVDYADAWLANLHNRRGGNLRGTSKRRVTYIVSLLKEAFPAPLHLSDLDGAVIRDWYERRRPESEWSFRECCIRLNAMLRDASDPVRDGGALIPANPYRLPIPPKPEIPSHECPPITADQLRGLYEAFPPYTRLSVLLVTLVGGMRTGEVCALQVGDIDLDERVLRVRHSVSRGDDDHGELRLGPTKTAKSHRTVPLPSGLIPLLRDHIRDYCPGGGPDAPLFAAKRGTRLSQRTLDHQMGVARKAIDRPDLTFRMLRASHATLYMLQGGTLRETMDQLGHATEKVAIDSYQRVVPEHQRAVADKVASRLLACPDDGAPSDAGGRVPSETESAIPQSEMPRLVNLIVDISDRLHRVETLAFTRLPALLNDINRNGKE